MVTIIDLAREKGCEPNVIRAFYPDGFFWVTSDSDEVPEEVATAIRAAWDDAMDPLDE
jgi:hypothetical protein